MGDRIDLPMEDIAAEYKSGLSITKIAKKYCVSYRCIYMRLDEENIIRRKTKAEIPRPELRQKYNVEHMTIAGMARYFGCSTQSIIKALRAAYIPRRPPGGRKNGNISIGTPLAVKFLRSTGMTVKQIAKRCKVSQRYVYYILGEDNGKPI